MDIEIQQPSLGDASPKDAEKLRPAHAYAQILRPELSPEIFEPYAGRLIWALGYVLFSLASLWAVSHGPWWSELPLYLAWVCKAALSIGAGMAFGCMGFFAHEVLHGSVVRSRLGQDILGFVGLLPWVISPTFWRYWHNQLHHGKTQALISDPDAFPTLKIYRHSKFMQFMYPFTPGSGHKRSLSYFFFWFSFHVLVAQFYLRFRNSLYERLDHKRVNWEMSAQLVIWAAGLYFLGLENIMWTFVLPFMAQNYFVMSYIATNHNLSPLTRINDPLVNSLTVTNWSWLEPLHLNFGYHVEHHLFPNINGVHAKTVHEALKRRFPKEFLYMPKSEAIRRLYKTARIYKNSTTLIHPETQQTFATLSGDELHSH